MILSKTYILFHNAVASEYWLFFQVEAFMGTDIQIWLLQILMLEKNVQISTK